MCKASISNAENAEELAGAINAAILVLLVPTLAIICALIRLVYKYHQPDDVEARIDSSSSNNSYVDFRSSNSQRDLE